MCEMAFIAKPCKYCKEQVIPFYLDEHYGECYERLQAEYQSLEMFKSGSILRQNPNEMECCICCLPIKKH
jgi:hypothetical protein